MGRYLERSSGMSRRGIWGGGGRTVSRNISGRYLNWGEKLTTQTPAMAYLPSAAFRSMTLALFSDRSSLGCFAAGSAMFGSCREGGKGAIADDYVVIEVVRCQLGGCADSDQLLIKKEWFRVRILLLC